MAEDSVEVYPDLIRFISLVHRDGEKPLFEFRFKPCKEVTEIFRCFKNPQQFAAEHPQHHMVKVWQAFNARKTLRGKLDRRDSIKPFNESFDGFVTRNVKLAAAIIASGKAAPLPSADDFIRRRDDHFVFQFDCCPEEVAAAFGDPKAFSETHRTHWLSYLTYAFYARERLLDAMKDPNRKVMRIRRVQNESGGETILFKPEPQKGEVHVGE